MGDWYAVLGVEASADEATIRAAYRQLARENHPDVNPVPGAAARMREINAAYETLRDAEKRKAFDDARKALHSAMAQASADAGTGDASERTRSVSQATPPRSSQPRAASSASGVGSSEASGSRAGTWRMSARVSAASQPEHGDRADAAAARPPTPAVAPASAGQAAVGVHAWYATPVTGGVLAGFMALVGALAVWAMMASAGGRSANPALHSSSAGYVPVSSTVSSASSMSPVPAASGVSSVAQTSGATSATSASRATSSAESANEVPAAKAEVVPAAQQSDFQAPLVPLPVTGTNGAAQPPMSQAPVAQTVPAQASPAQSVVSQGQAAQVQSMAQQPAVHGATSRSAAAQPQTSQVSPASSLSPAQRALATYDRAWTNYVQALRLASAGQVVSGGNSVNSAALRASLSGAGAAAFLSGDAQTSVARAVYLDAELAWNRQTSVALAPSGRPGLRPDASGEARAVQKLSQAAELVAAGSGSPAVAAQVRTLLDEADQLHHAAVGEWATYLASAGA